MRNSWTDDRLDDFAKHVDRRFDEVDRRFDEVNGRLDRIEARIEAGLDKVDARIDGLHHAMNRSIIQVGLMLMVTLALGFLGIVLH